MIAMSCSRIPATYATSRPYTRRAAPTSRFWSASTNSSAPSLIPHVPAARITWGGDSTFTSSPYALCHQLSSGAERSEEHTSELQSPYDLVCRLLLEKKKKET